MSTTMYFVPVDESANEHELTPCGYLADLQRLDRGDRVEGQHHIFRHTFSNAEGWYWGDRQRYIARYREGGVERWSYVFYFENGTRGMCRVNHVNDALAAIGYRVDLDPPI